MLLTSPYQLFDLNSLLNFSLPRFLLVLTAMIVPAPKSSGTIK